MIVKNEEEFLERCLSSVKNLVNEMIIVDTGSTDSTIEIAKKFNAKVYDFQWKGDFAAARNFSITKASSDYILVLDADEYLDEHGYLLVNNINTGKDYYIVNIKNYVDDKVFNHQAIRVFKRNTGLLYKGKIHEHLNIDDFIGLTQETADIWIHHTGYQSNLYHKRNKHERNLKLLLEEVENNPSGYNYFNLGNQYKANGEFDKALSAYKQSFYLSKDRVYLSYLLNQMGKCLLHLSRFEDGIQLMSDSIAGFPNYTDLYFTLGGLYESRGYLNDSERCYVKCLELGEVKDIQTTEGVGSYLAHFNLSKVYEKKGDLSKALEQCVISLRENRNNVSTLLNLIKLLIKGNIPLGEMIKFIDNCYPIRNQQHLNNLIIALFITRSPLLSHYIDYYHLNVENIIEIIALQYGQREKEAFNKWKTVDNVSYELAEDIFAVSIKYNNAELLSLIEQYFTKKDFETIKNLIDQKEIDNLSNKLSDFIKKVIPKLGLLCESDKLQFLLNIISKNNSKEITDVINSLIEIGLKDTIIGFINIYLSNSNSVGYLDILTDLYTRNGSVNEALRTLNKLVEMKNEYRYYEKIYNITAKLQKNTLQEFVKKQIIENFPLAKWVK
jgi:glycosyltransferase involved in cell wall biosynthesis